ncbi:hypothetical protein ACWEWD_09240 [Streptomyces tendae]
MGGKPLTQLPILHLCLVQGTERRRQDEIEAARQKRIRWEAAMQDARI